MSNELPHCPNCHREQALLNENENAWAFRCPYCYTSRIITKPTLRGASQLELALKRRREQEQRQRALESLPRYSFPARKEIA